ncbi:MAG: glycosyltransferase family 39 protein [Lachnospiraceae bacterium]|nr:glycosyltransferase family 39 protein [Lachnospiraceae bacterium]
MKEKKQTQKIINISIAVIGILAAALRLLYIYYTPTWRRQHDVIDFGAEEGQAPFIEYFYNGHLLIDFDPREKWGFFQPPFHHMLAALWIHIQELVGIGYEAACEHVQVLTLVYSLITLYFAYLIFRYFKLEGVPLLAAFTIAAIHPGFILMSGSINNDMLAIMFTVMTIYFGLKWNDERSWKYTIILAFTIGLGMMTKISAALVAPAIALLFVIRCIQGGIDSFAQYMKKFVVFGFICGPLALWSPIRNQILFGVPLNYTPEVGEGITASLAARIFDVRSSIPYVSRISNGDPYDEFNMLLGMMKTSLFGDENFAYAMAEAGHNGLGANLITAFGWILFISGTILAALGLYTTVRVLITKAYVESIVIRMYLGTIYLVSVIMYIYFMISAPYYSSMDFRYVLYLVPLEALMLGLYIEKSNAAFRRVSLALTGVFAVSAAAVYLLLSRA